MSDEKIGIGTVEDDDLGRRMVLHRVKKGGQLSHHLEREDIDRRIIDGDAGDAALGNDVNGLVWGSHEGSSSCEKGVP